MVFFGNFLFTKKESYSCRGTKRPIPRPQAASPIPRRHQPPPTHCGAPRRNGRDLIIAKNDQRTNPYPHCCQRQRRRDNFAPRRELLLSAVTKVAKNTGRNCVSALPQRAMHVHCHPRFPSRNRRFPDRCRSPDCASTAFRCRCLLLRQKLFVLPCRRLRNNYILCPTGTPTFAAARRQRRDLIIAQPQGVVSKGGGRSPLLCRFKGLGFLRKGGNSKSPFP